VKETHTYKQQTIEILRKNLLALRYIKIRTSTGADFEWIKLIWYVLLPK